MLFKGCWYFKNIHTKKTSCEPQFQMKLILLSNYEILIFTGGGWVWEIHSFSCHCSLLAIAGDTSPDDLPSFFILIKLTFACDLHIERWPLKGSSLPSPRHTGSETRPETPVRGGSCLGKESWETCLPTARWALISRFLLSTCVQLCKSFFCLPGFI